MSDGLGFGTISGTFLEKVQRDERLTRDLPRRGRDPKPERERAVEPDDEATAASDDDAIPASAVHIDLRI